MTSLLHIQRQSDFCLPRRRLPLKTILGNLSSFILRTCASHLNLSFILNLESGMGPYLSHSLLFEIQSVCWMPKTIRRKFIWKRSMLIILRFLEHPWFKIILDHFYRCSFQYSKLNAQTYLPIIRKLFKCKKRTPRALVGYSTFNILTIPTVVSNNTSWTIAAIHLTHLFITQYLLFTFTYFKS